MATTNDIDTQSAVQKFLGNQTVSNREDPTADSSDEVQAVLESVALSFLLYPQAALSFVLRAKNVLQQIVSTDLDIVSYLLETLADLNNPDEPITDTTDLINAQTALVEIDRIGRVGTDVPAYQRYGDAVNGFLDKRLAKSLKRNRTGGFERTGLEAKQDLFNVLSLFTPAHQLMISRIGQLLNGVNDFNSVDLTRVVSTSTLSKVRSSLAKVINGVQAQALSKTAIAIELLAGAASLSSISNSKDLYDPTVETGLFPPKSVITASSERVAAVAVGTSATTDLSARNTPWVFGITTDPELGGTSYAITLPFSGASGRYWVAAKSGSSTFNIPIGNNALYVQFDGVAPDTIGPVLYPKRIRTVLLPTGGAVALSAILSALNNGTTGLIDGTAVEMAPGTGRILIYGSSSVTGITILPRMGGTFDSFGNYTEAINSVHSILGFLGEQTAGNPSQFSPSDIADFIDVWVPTATASIVNEAVQVQSDSTELLSSLSFSNLASDFGFSTTTYEARPSYIEFFENGAVIDPSTVGVFVGSIVSLSDVSASITRNLFAPIIDINGSKIFFDDSLNLPRCTDKKVIVTCPLVFAVQQLLNSLIPFEDQFDTDFSDLQRVLTPILSNPTKAQISDANNVITSIQTKIQSLLAILQNTVVRDDRVEFGPIADQITASLEERSIDRGLDLLHACQFSAFFALTREDASKGSRLLKASEILGQTDLASTTIEQDIPDLKPTGTTPDNNLLNGMNLPEDEEQV
jgi:hypothetical protein